MRNVLLYLRKSRDDENESKEETLARHERMLIDYCQSQAPFWTGRRKCGNIFKNIVDCSKGICYS